MSNSKRNWSMQAITTFLTWCKQVNLPCVAACWMCFPWAQSGHTALICLAMKSTASKPSTPIPSAPSRLCLKSASCPRMSSQPMRPRKNCFAASFVNTSMATQPVPWSTKPSAKDSLAAVSSIICRCFLSSRWRLFLIICLKTRCW